jgi:tRNA dimethylallyltransferase
LADLPDADPVLREHLLQEAKQNGWPALHARLQALDPVSAARIHPNDPQRIQRALEVCLLAGEPMSVLLGRQAMVPLPYRVRKLILAPRQRDVLRQRIARRFEQMLEQGLLEEVRRLYRRGDLDLSKPAIRSVGYRQVWRFLSGELSHAEMVKAAVTATRQLAKRQMTWLRGETEAIWVNSEAPDVLYTVLKCSGIAPIH